MALRQKDFTAAATSASGIPYKYILRVIENSINVGNNSSSVTVQAILSAEKFSFSFSNWGTGVSCTLNGKEIFNSYASRNFTAPGETVFYTWTGNISHNSDGTLRLKAGGRLWQNSSENWTPPEMKITESDSVYLVLTPIARESTVGADDAYIESNTTISVKRGSPELTHVIGWEFGTMSGYIGSDWGTSKTPVKLTDTSISFQIPAIFYDEIPDTDRGVCTLTITTYNGNTQVGEPKSAEFQCMADPKKCVPEIQCDVVDVNATTLEYTGNGKRIVRYLSTARCTFTTAMAKNGASIQKLQVNGKDVNADNYVDIEGASDTVFTFYAEDSRGFSARFVPDDLTLVPYIFPTANAVCKRSSPTGSTAILTVEGEFFNGDFGTDDNQINIHVYVNDEKVDVTDQWDIDGNTYGLVVALKDLDYQNAYDIEVTVSDSVKELGTSVIRSITLPRGIPVFDWGENSFRFNVPVFIGEKTLEQYIKDVMNGG